MKAAPPRIGQVTNAAGVAIQRAKRALVAPDEPRRFRDPQLDELDEVLLQIISWAAGVIDVMGKKVATEPGTLQALAFLNRKWHQLIQGAAQQLGYCYWPEIRLLVNPDVSQGERGAPPVPRLRIDAGGLSSPTTKPILGRDDAWGIHDMARTVVTKYAPGDHVFVSLGNSPSLVMEYVALMVPGAKVVHFPISALTPELLVDVVDEINAHPIEIRPP